MKETTPPQEDSSDIYMSYDEKKVLFSSMLTVYGRKPVLEALALPDIVPFRLHLAESNRPSDIIKNMLHIASQRKIEVKYHSRQALSRISKNSKQDQGVVLDIKAPSYLPTSKIETTCNAEYIALENVTNPQNVGMTIRSVGASPCQGIILPKKGNANIDPLVIKASAGTALKVPIYHCQEAITGLKELKDRGFRLIGLSLDGSTSINKLEAYPRTIFVLGNETKGLSIEMKKLCDELAHIPLNNDVESLNVSITASIVAFRSIF
ncbi:MAG: 23S rRNA (guanosine2251-2'-O)-methyltransferase [Flavobacterium sp.]|jgi:23S rRNA (guanosine2251-2'-O)-methyltransferase